MMKRFRELSPDAQAKIVLGFTVAQILVNAFIFVGLVAVMVKIFFA